MKQKIDFLKGDLAVQKRKLEDLKNWGSLQILIDAQTRLVTELEKQVAEEGDDETGKNEDLFVLQEPKDCD
jgi:hypothetical protein